MISIESPLSVVIVPFPSRGINLKPPFFVASIIIVPFPLKEVVQSIVEKTIFSAVLCKWKKIFLTFKVYDGKIGFSHQMVFETYSYCMA